MFKMTIEQSKYSGVEFTCRDQDKHMLDLLESYLLEFGSCNGEPLTVNKTHIKEVCDE